MERGLPWSCSEEASVSTVTCRDTDYILKQKAVVLGGNVEKLAVTDFSLYSFLGCSRMFRKLTWADTGGHLRAWQLKEDTYTESSF